MIKDLLLKNVHKMSKMSDRFLAVNEMFGQGILWQEGIEWKKQRQLLAPLFTYQVLQGRIPLINDAVNQLTERIKLGDGEIMENLKQTTGEIVGLSFFGKQFVKNVVNGKPITLELSTLIDEMMMISITNWATILKYNVLGTLHKDKVPYFLFQKKEKQLLDRVETINEVIRNEIQEREKVYEESEIKSDFISYLIENLKNKTLSKDHTTHLFITLFFAGMDTTAHLSLMCIYYLAIHPDIQEVLRKEANQYIEADQDINIDNLNKLKNLASFINEVLRMKSPAPTLLPRIAQEDFYVKDVFVPKGSLVNVNFMGNNMSEVYHQEPEKFDLQRNYPSDSYSFTPFSAGPRNCIGQHLALIELKIILIKLMKKFSIHKNEKVKLVMVQSFMYKPNDTNLVTFKPLF